MSDFDWSWPSRIDRAAVEFVLGLGFLEQARNVVLVAPQGLGKTMIAQNLVHQALLAGHGALFITAAQLLLDLGAQESARALDRRLRYYTSRPLLCIDEIGYLSYDRAVPDLLRKEGIEVRRVRLDDADYDLGSGVLVERKTVKDLLANFTERLPQQVYRMAEACEWPVLVVEGDLFGATARGSIPYRGRMAFLWWAYFKKGVWLAQTKNEEQTAQWLARIAMQLKEGAKPPQLHKAKSAPARAHQLCLLRALPGIGPVGAAALIERFGTARAVMAATEEELASVKNIGRAKAKEIAAVLDTSVG